MFTSKLINLSPITVKDLIFTEICPSIKDMGEQNEEGMKRCVYVEYRIAFQSK